MTKCPKCGAEIKYIPLGRGIMGPIAVVDPEYREIITDGGRVVNGHHRHKCPETKDGNTELLEER